MTRAGFEDAYEFDGALRARLAGHLAAHDRRSLDAPRRAAVAIIVAPVDGIAHYVFTQRSFLMRRGAGQYALPGGGVDGAETPAQTACREVREELGIELDVDCVLGTLDDFVTRTAHVITPVVLWAGAPVEFVTDPEEVHAAWFVPVHELDHLEAPRWVDGDDDAAVVQMPVRGEWINPPTAAILWQFRDVALHGRDVRVAHVGQPGWTAR